MAMRPLARSTDSSPADPPVCASCRAISGLMMELYAATKSNAMEASFDGQKEEWEKSCAAAGTARELADCLFVFETEMRSDYVNAKWHELKTNWEYKLQSCPRNDCSQVALLMYEFESYVLWKAVEEGWKKDRKTWAKEVRTLYPANLRMLSDGLLGLERYTNTQHLSPRWMTERARWLHRTCYCRCVKELSASLLSFESRIEESSMVEEWREMRSRWVESLSCEYVSCSRLASLMLELERSMREGVMVPAWANSRRSWVLSINNIAGVGR